MITTQVTATQEQAFTGTAIPESAGAIEVLAAEDEFKNYLRLAPAVVTSPPDATLHLFCLTKRGRPYNRVNISLLRWCYDSVRSPSLAETVSPEVLQAIDSELCAFLVVGLWRKRIRRYCVKTDAPPPQKPPSTSAYAALVNEVASFLRISRGRMPSEVRFYASLSPSRRVLKFALCSVIEDFEFRQSVDLACQNESDVVLERRIRSLLGTKAEEVFAAAAGHVRAISKMYP